MPDDSGPITWGYVLGAILFCIGLPLGLFAIALLLDAPSKIRAAHRRGMDRVRRGARI